MDKVTIAEIGVEGGGVTIYGIQSQGVWTFWTEGTSVSSLDLVLPKDWPLFHPIEVHPDFVDWFRSNYDNVRGSLPEDQRRSQEKHRHGHWMQILAMPR
jgi:hypothetical protein